MKKVIGILLMLVVLSMSALAVSTEKIRVDDKLNSGDTARVNNIRYDINVATGDMNYLAAYNKNYMMTKGSFTVQQGKTKATVSWNDRGNLYGTEIIQDDQHRLVFNANVKIVEKLPGQRPTVTYNNDVTIYYMKYYNTVAIIGSNVYVIVY